MAYTSPSTRAAGYVAGATQWNEFVNNDKWANESTVSGKPMVAAYRSSALAIAHNTPSTVAWNAESLDNTGAHSTGVNPTRLTAPVDGYYWTFANVVWAANATGLRSIDLVPNILGVPANRAGQTAFASLDCGQSVGGVLALHAGEYVEIACYQTCGVSLNIQTGSTAWFEWIAGL